MPKTKATKLQSLLKYANTLGLNCCIRKIAEKEKNRFFKHHRFYICARRTSNPVNSTSLKIFDYEEKEAINFPVLQGVMIYLKETRFPHDPINIAQDGVFNCDKIDYQFANGPDPVVIISAYLKCEACNHKRIMYCKETKLPCGCVKKEYTDGTIIIFVTEQTLKNFG